MSIYNINKKNIKKYLIEFSKTYYGKITFVVSYTPTFVILFFGIALMILLKQDINTPIIYISMICAMMLSLLIGTKHYYHELKGYLKHKKD